MSGGHFNDGSYSYLKVLEFAESLNEEILNNGSPDDFGDVTEFNEETLEFLKEKVKEIRRVGHLMWDIDKLYSGDIGEETFKERCLGGGA
jgi:hypothetical protein